MEAEAGGQLKMDPSRRDRLIEAEQALVAEMIDCGSPIMNAEADEVFRAAGLSTKHSSDFYRIVCHQLGRRMAELSIRMGLGEIGWSERILLFDKTKAALVEEIRPR